MLIIIRQQIKTLFQQGKIETVENSPFDFRQFKTIGKDIDTLHQQLKNGSGYDHNFVINGKENELKLAAEGNFTKNGYYSSSIYN